MKGKKKKTKISRAQEEGEVANVEAKNKEDETWEKQRGDVHDRGISRRHENHIRKSEKRRRAWTQERNGRWKLKKDV